nr:nodulation protein [Melilotus officinalis]
MASQSSVSSLNALSGTFIREGIYLFRVGKIIENVIKEKEKLISNHELVLKKVEEKNKTEKVNDIVIEWLNDVDKVMEEEEKMEIEMEILEILCTSIDSERRYRLYNEMLMKIKTLNTNCEFEPFSSPIPGLEYFSFGNFVCFESTKVASDQLLEALQDGNCYIIGLYGKKGSGKTKLVKAVGEKAKYLKIFDAVLLANASQNPNVRAIQDKIAESLNLKFDRNTEAGRARTISSALQSRDRILVILNDVRTKLELEDIGIPCNGNRCKVLLTTRRQRECALMDCQREIPLGPLSKDEAWTLLKKHSGIDDESSSDILDVAHQVAYECEGLPGTIKEMGSSLKSKPVEEWKESLDSLRHSMAHYHIFLSFRGEDTRYSFTGSLYRALCQVGFKTFMDEGGLEGGDQISISLLYAIEASRLSIIVLSENFAYSSWCLDELVMILECMKMKNQLVWPIFYKVDPSDVRYQKNSYGKAMIEHENKFGNDYEKIQKWRSALFQVANLSGLCYTTGYEYDFIQMILERANNIKTRLYIQSMDMD